MARRNPQGGYIVPITLLLALSLIGCSADSTPIHCDPPTGLWFGVWTKRSGNDSCEPSASYTQKIGLDFFAGEDGCAPKVTPSESGCDFDFVVTCRSDALDADLEGTLSRVSETEYSGNVRLRIESATEQCSGIYEMSYRK